MLEVRNLKKSYQKLSCLKGVSFQVKAGEIVALLGPNGAGKTTTINCILNLLEADSGEILLNGRALSRQKMNLGCTPQESHFPEHLKLEEILQFVCAHFTDSAGVESLIKDFELQNFRWKKCHQLSGGQRRALGLACAFAGNPKLLVLDEPSVGLDSEVRIKIWQKIRAAAKKGAVVLITSHHFDEIEQLAERILVLDQGQVIKEGRIDQIKAELGYSRIQFYSSSQKKLLDLPDYEIDGPKHFIVTKNSDEVVRQLAKTQKFENLQVPPLSLEEVFLKITGREQRGEN